MTQIQDILDQRPDIKDTLYRAVEYPRYECPHCGYPINKKDYEPMSKSIICNMCEKAALSDFTFIERR